MANPLLIKQKERLEMTVEENGKVMWHPLEGACVEHKFHHCIARSAPIFMVVLSREGEVRMMNNTMLQALGYTAEEAEGNDYIHTFVPPTERARVAAVFKEITGLKRPTWNENNVLTKSGDKILAEWYGNPVLNGQGELEYFFGVGIDITRRRQAEEALRQSEAKFKAAFEGIHDAVTIVTQSGKFLDCNRRALALFGLSRKEEFQETLPRDFSPPFQPDGRDSVAAAREQLNKTFALGHNHFEWLHQRKNGETFYAEIMHTVYRLGKELVLQAGIRDITERKRDAQRLEYLSLHDQLTGLYNRAFFVEEMRRLGGGREYPITIISVDVDGLKLVNDSMGHAKGDELLTACAEVLRRSLRGADILARPGGDEFAVLLPRTDKATAEVVAVRIKDNLTAYNREHLSLFLSLSLGIATAANENISLEETYKKADIRMYREKLSRRRTLRKKTISRLMTTLVAKDHFAEGHVEKLAALCQSMGKRLNLSKAWLDKLLLLARIHDLGKVAIADDILFKPGPLSKEEWEIMRQHPEKGYAIAVAAPEFSDVAELVLKHHERWDGSGYPLGLKGEEIPLECRVFSIINAYDSLTSERSHRHAWTREQALEYIRQQSGTQFELRLVELFLEEMEAL